MFRKQERKRSLPAEAHRHLSQPAGAYAPFLQNFSLVFNAMPSSQTSYRLPIDYAWTEVLMGHLLSPGAPCTWCSETGKRKPSLPCTVSAGLPRASPRCTELPSCCWTKMSRTLSFFQLQKRLSWNLMQENKDLKHPFKGKFKVHFLNFLSS